MVEVLRYFGSPGPISVFLADDNLIVREGVRALLALEDDFSVVGTAADYDELVTRASELAPQVVVTDIRMPPTFHQEGIQAAHEIRTFIGCDAAGDPEQNPFAFHTPIIGLFGNAHMI